MGGLFQEKLWVFNLKVFYGVLPVEKRLRVMRKSDGVCKICCEDMEDAHHLFLKCNKLQGIWHKVESVINSLTDYQINISYCDMCHGYN